MGKWMCTPCGYIYDPAEGDFDGGIAPGTAFEDLSDTWFCPNCNGGKEFFEKKEYQGMYLMNLNGSKQVCGICMNWKGKRDFIDGLQALVKSSSKGQCVLLKKLKPPQGGCNHWQKWNGVERPFV